MPPPPPKKNAPGRGLEGVTGGSWGEFGWVWRPLLTNFGLLGTLWGPIFWVHVADFSDQAQKICNGRLFGATIVPFGRYLVPSILCWPRRDARSVIIYLYVYVCSYVYVYSYTYIIYFILFVKEW